MFTVRFVDPGVELRQHLYSIEKDQPLYQGNYSFQLL